MPRPAWKFAIFSALATLTADVSVAAKPAPVKDFSRQVEVVAGGRLRETTAGQGELAVSLWNKTKSAIAGPIFLVIDESGLESVQVGSHGEETAQGKPVFELVPVGRQLLPGGMTPSLPVAFHIPAGMPREDANKVRLKTRVFGREAPADVAALAREKADREDADFSTRGKSYTQADLDGIRELQQQVSPELVKKPDVIGTAITEDSQGKLALRVYTESRAAAKTLPSRIGDYPVDIQPVPGGFKTGPSYDSVSRQSGGAASRRTRDARELADEPQRNKAGDNAQLVTRIDPMQRFARPVPIGVSAFNSGTLDGNTICAAGTLGCRCIDSSGKLYALSNAHVFSDFGFATLGEVLVQPSQGDNNCVTDIANNAIGILVATTRYQNLDPQSRFFNPSTLPMNFSDAGLAAVSSVLDSEGNQIPAVGFSTPSDGYGAPSSRVLLQSRLGLQVQKYGRTTGYTRGITTAIDIYAPIGPNPDTTDNFRLDEYYGMAGYFPFGDGGDSGSLIVTLDDRRPVSLLFAGNSIRTLANKIGPVLDRFNVRVDDGTNPNATTAGAGTAGLTGRGGIAFGNLTDADLGLVVVTTTNGVTVITQLLPAELRGRVKPNRRPLIPVHNGRFT